MFIANALFEAVSSSRAGCIFVTIEGVANPSKIGIRPLNLNHMLTSRNAVVAEDRLIQSARRVGKFESVGSQDDKPALSCKDAHAVEFELDLR